MVDGPAERVGETDSSCYETGAEEAGREAVEDPADAAKTLTTVALECKKNGVGNNLSVPLYEEVDARVKGKIRRLRVMYDSGATDTLVRRQADAAWAFETLRVLNNHIVEDYSGKTTEGRYNLKKVEIFGGRKWR